MKSHFLSFVLFEIQKTHWLLFASSHRVILNNHHLRVVVHHDCLLSLPYSRVSCDFPPQIACTNWLIEIVHNIPIVLSSMHSIISKLHAFNHSNTIHCKCGTTNEKRTIKTKSKLPFTINNNGFVWRWCGDMNFTSIDTLFAFGWIFCSRICASRRRSRSQIKIAQAIKLIYMHAVIKSYPRIFEYLFETFHNCRMQYDCLYMTVQRHFAG